MLFQKQKAKFFVGRKKTDTNGIAQSKLKFATPNLEEGEDKLQQNQVRHLLKVSSFSTNVKTVEGGEFLGGIKSNYENYYWICKRNNEPQVREKK